MLEPNITLQNRYQIIRMLAQGGMGAVYEAKDQRLGNIVALKETFFADEDLRRAFHREAGILATLRHPALPKVIDHFSEGDGQFLVMEFIKGDDLYQLLKRNNGPISQREVLKWADQLLGTLEYLHSQQPPVIHRDIKPQNLKLNEKGEIVLLDFGLAKEDADVTMAAKSVFGYSLNYAPLEQIQSKGTDPRSDIYSVAATLYHLLTGIAPADAVNRATAVIEGSPDTLRPAAEVNPAVSLEVSSIIEQALSLDRNRRPTNAYILRGQIQRAISAVERAMTNAATQQHQGQQYQGQIPHQQTPYGGPRPTTPYATQQNPQGGGTYATMPPAQNDKIRFEIPLQSPQQGSGQFPPAGYDANATNAYSAISTAEPSKSKGGLIAGMLIALLAVGGGAYWMFLRGDNVGTNASGEIVINGIKPDKLAENIISDTGSQTDRLYQFTAHAGQITFTLDAVGSGSTVSLEALRNGKELLRFDGDKPSLTVTSDNKLDARIIGSLIMPKDETIVLRVKTSSPTSLTGFRVLIDGSTSLTTRANDDPKQWFGLRDKPTTPSYNTILGTAIRKESYYTFNAAQGDLSVDVGLLGNSQLSVEIFSEKGGEPLKFTGDQPNITVTSDGMIEQASGTVTISEPQKLVMRIVNSSKSQAYKIKLGGTAQLKDRPAGMKMTENQANAAKLLEGRENPTAMTSSEISGVIPGKESYFTFTGGPGSVNVILELESSGAVSTIQFFDSQSKRIPLSNGSDTLKLTTSGRTEASVTLPSEDKILMRVGVSAPGNVTSFTLKLDGNIKL